MRREDILRMAHESRITNPDDGQIKFGQPMVKCLEQFAALVAAAEREACAKACEDIPLPKNPAALTHIPTLERCVAAIRARGNTP